MQEDYTCHAIGLHLFGEVPWQPVDSDICMRQSRIYAMGHAVEHVPERALAVACSAGAAAILGDGSCSDGDNLPWGFGALCLPDTALL